MPSLETSLAFFSVAVLLALAPGPDNVFVLMQSASHGRRAGAAVVLGLMLGVLGHTAAVALGLAALLAASATAFTAIKLAGAAYLLYLAWGAWRAPATLGATAPGAEAASPTLAWWPLVGRGVLMNLSNPKVALFFLALLPQFVQSGRGPVALQILWLGVLFIVAATLVFGAVVWLAGALRLWLTRSARAQRGIHRASALVFVLLALRLALYER